MGRGQAKRGPVLNRLFRRFSATGDTAGFVHAVAGRYTVPTLERLAEAGGRAARRAATAALGLLGDFSVSGILGRRMSDRDRAVRLLAERYIREVWCRDGSHEQQHRLQRIMRLNDYRRSQEAVREATELIEEAPGFAEVWNQRAVAYFLLQDYGRSARDCHQTLELNPYHFGAAVGMGYCYLEMDKGRLALEAFRRALKLNPNLERVRAQVTRLEQSLEGK
jgi:tetratricopeptide (TPR) repeat protein